MEKIFIELGDLSIKDALQFFIHFELTETEHAIADRLLKEIINRLQFLNNVGFHIYH